MASSRVAKRNVLVKSSTAVEAIGAVRVICTDKTGTLTQNRLSLSRCVSPRGEVLDDAGGGSVLLAALVASDVHRPLVACTMATVGRREARMKLRASTGRPSVPDYGTNGQLFL